MFIFGRTNGTLELHTFITSFTEKLHILSVRSTLGNSTAPQPLVVQLLLPSPSLPLHHLRWLSGYFLVFQLATWSAFRPFRGLSLKRSSNTSQRYGSPLLSSPSDPTYTCTQSSSEERSTGCSPRRHTHRRENPPFSLSSRRRKKLSPYRLLRGVSRERHRTFDC